MKWSRELKGVVWRYPGAGGWHFVTLPPAAGREIRELFGGGAGWGSVRVEASVGKTTWKTSIFPDKKSGSYLLPIKSGVREAERLDAGSRLRFRLVIEP